MRTPTLLAVPLLALALVAPHAGALGLEVRFLDDGLTAEITFPGSTLDLLLQPGPAGQDASIRLFTHSPTWKQASMVATLRIFQAGFPEVDVYSQPFLSSASAPTVLTVPPGVFQAGSSYDVFVTFSSVGGNPVPTSHHSIVKHALIGVGQFSLAEGFDYNLATRPLVLA